MNILEQIIADKKREIAQKKQSLPISYWEQQPYFERPVVSVTASVKNTTGIITEFKRQSPSKGIINNNSSVEDVVKGYDLHGSACMSILTDEKYFGGNNDDVLRGRVVTEKPILRKEFIIDEYQLVEAKAIGADVILLIAACLTPAETKRLATFAKGLGLEILLELHDAEELGHVCDEVDLVGINNRNLKTFEVNWQHSIDLAARLPKDKLKIAESGIHSVDTLLMLQQNGFDGFLIGENFMKHNDPTIAFASFVKELRSKTG
ncbi:MAG: indole-3-glycerol phosphate synthase TrpC [Bacteroidota bacterium]